MVIPMMMMMQSSNGNELQNHLICTNISVKLGIVPICIRIGITIGFGSVGTVLHIIIEPNFIGIGIGIGVGQCNSNS